VLQKLLIINQDNIYASYQVAEMAFFEYYKYSFFSTDSSGILGGLNLDHA